MNLQELDKLIQILIDEDIPENDAWIELYLRERKELISQICEDLKDLL